MKDLKVIFMGTPDFALEPLKYFIENTNVVLVVTQPDKEVGRDHKMSFSPVKKMALENKIDVFQPEKIRKDFEIISEINPDLIVTCAYGQILPKEILDIPSLGAINIHASLLPKYRGATPIQSALLNGEAKTGITLMYMDEGMDTGDIINTISLDIDPDDDAGSLFTKLSKLAPILLKETIPLIYNKTNKRISQNNDLATYTKMIKREDEHLDFNEKGGKIINKIRALNPWPGVSFYLENIEIKVIKAHFKEQKSEVGKITYTKDEMLIGCQDGVISLDIIKPQGKKAMPIKAYINGAKKDILYVK